MEHSVNERPTSAVVDLQAQEERNKGRKGETDRIEKPKRERRTKSPRRRKRTEGNRRRKGRRRRKELEGGEKDIQEIDSQEQQRWMKLQLKFATGKGHLDDQQFRDYFSCFSTHSERFFRFFPSCHSFPFAYFFIGARFRECVIEYELVVARVLRQINTGPHKGQNTDSNRQARG